jgi:response regulator RpfG family c-di-GMP phosphodiesterase
MIASYLYDIYRTDFGKILHQGGRSEEEKIDLNRSWLTARILEQIDMPENIRQMISSLHAIAVTENPDELEIEQIPLGARIIAMIDAFEDIVARNPQGREDMDAAVEALRLNSGRLFDRRVVEHFCQVLQDERFLNRAGARQKEIALIDDDPDTAMLLELRLVNEGFIVRIYDDSAAAFREFSARPPNLIVSERRADRIDGFRLIKKLKKEPLLQDIPVFFMSREDDAATIMQGLNLGAEDYFVKPFNLEIFYAKISKSLKKLRSGTGKDGAQADGVTGSLKEMAFTDIIQILAAGLKTVQLTVDNGSCRGHVFLEKGKIVDARAGELEGEEALFGMILWEDGTFTVNPDVTAEKQTIESSNDALLLEGCRRKDEAALVKAD